MLYVRAARLFDELQVAHGDGSFARRLAALAKLGLLVIDDFAISPMGPVERNDLLELLDDRIGTRSNPWYSLAQAEMLDVAHMGLHVTQMTSQAAMRQCVDAVTRVG